MLNDVVTGDVDTLFASSGICCDGYQDVFLLNTPKQLFLYVGQNSQPEERSTAARLATALFPKKSPELSQGPKPSKEFLANMRIFHKVLLF